MNRLALFLSIICSLLSGLSARGEDEIRIGVLADRGRATCLRMWSDTAGYLSEKIPGKTFSIVPLNFEDVLPAAENKEVDFFLVNSSMYVELEVTQGVSRVATLLRKGANNIPHSVFGGVVFFHKQENPNPDWKDLEKSRITAVNPSSFGGWLAPLREMKLLGLNTRKIFDQTVFTNNEDQVVYAVRDGRADAGIVRTDILEHMAQEGEIQLENYVTLEWSKETVEIHQDYGYRHSTRLYPEWAIARAIDIPDELANNVAIALLEIAPDSQAALSAGYKGWILPKSYIPVRECLQELRVRPFENFGYSTFSRKIREYGLALLVILTAMVAIIWILFLKRLVNLRIYGNRTPGAQPAATAPGLTNLISVSGPWIIIGLVFICVLGNYILRSHVVLPRFLALEEREARTKISDAVEAIRWELKHLETTCHDWAFWDDTYAYVQDRNSDYIESNMSWPELHESGIDMVILCNPEGEVIWKEIHHSSETDPITLETFSVNQFAPDNPLVLRSWTPEQESNNGFFMTEHGPLMVAVSSIKTSDGEGPSRGTMIFGRFISEDLLAQISDQLKVSCKVTHPEHGPERDILNSLSPRNQILEFPSSHELLGYGLLTGMDGSPQLLVRIQSPREIMDRGRSIAGLISLIMFSAVVIICVGLFVWFSFLIIESVRRRRLIEKLVEERTSDLKKREEELQLANENLKLQSEYAFRMAEAADEANQVKSTFISNLGHEIKTPMQAVLGFTELVLRTDLTPKQVNYLHKIKSSTNSLSGILKDIFDFSTIEKGQIQIRSVPFTLDELKRELTGLFAPAAELKGLQLNIDFSTCVRNKLLGDPLRIRQILGNLLANAVKFTNKGNVSLTASVRETTDESVDILFEVKDTGIGISQENIDKIFAAFMQIDSSRTRQYGGIGIGLAVAQRLASLMGSNIHVESELGKGSVFSLDLSFKLYDREQLVKESIKASPSISAEEVPNPESLPVSDELKAILVELAIQLEEGDSDAIHILEEMATNKAFPGADQLLRLVKQYDFEGALDGLRKMAKEVGIDLNADP